MAQSDYNFFAQHLDNVGLFARKDVDGTSNEFGHFGERRLAPTLVQPHVALAVVVVSLICCNECAWKMPGFDSGSVMTDAMTTKSDAVSLLDKKDVYFGALANSSNSSYFAAESKLFSEVISDKVAFDSMKAVDAADSSRDQVSGTVDRSTVLKCVGVSAALILISLSFFVHPVVVAIVSLCVLMTLVEVLACMNLWGHAIDDGSALQLAISAGLALVHAVHTGLSFMAKTGTRSERVVEALNDVGSSGLKGGIYTFVLVVLTAFSERSISRVILQTLTVSLGLVQGMLVLPALLFLFGPDSMSGRAENDA
jgi:hypothetical protein